MQKLTLFTLGFIFTFSITAFADKSPSLVNMPIGKIYVPDGFDDNDNAQIVGEGFYPDSCYRPALSKISVDLEKKEITLTPMAYKYDGYCLMVTLPFEISFQFGTLNSGLYTIKQPDGKSLGAIDIRRSTRSEPDDFLYAPVSQAFILKESSTSMVHLTGEFPLSCLKMKEVRFKIQTDVIVIQPIAEIDSTSNCVPGSFAFNAQAELGDLKPGKYLLHVRSMNGKSINNIVQLN